MKWFIKCMQNYANFSGRARRKEFWYFVLFSILLSIPFGIVVGLLKGMTGKEWPEYINYLYQIAIIVPTIAVSTRRMHDVGKSGWYQLIPIYSLVLQCTEGTKGDNEYGPDPKDEAGDIATA